MRKASRYRLYPSDEQAGLREPSGWGRAVCLQLGVSVGDHDLPDARPRDHAVLSGKRRVSPLQVEARPAMRDPSPRRQNLWGHRRGLPSHGGVDSLVFRRRFSGAVKTVPVRRVLSGKFLVAVLGGDETQVPDAIAATWERAVGGELGLHAFLVLSAGEKVGIPSGWKPKCIV